MKRKVGGWWLCFVLWYTLHVDPLFKSGLNLEAVGAAVGGPFSFFSLSDRSDRPLNHGVQRPDLRVHRTAYSGESTP